MTDTPQTIPVFIVLQPNALLLDVAGPAEILRRAMVEVPNLRFEVTYVGAKSKVTTSMGLTLCDIAPLPQQLPDNAMVMLCGSASSSLMPDPPAKPAADQDRQDIIAWLRTTVRPAHTLISVCSGALLAGAAGLLDNRQCTTHHACCAELQTLVPSARVHDNRLYVIDGNCYSSAGITAGIDLMLHIMTKMIGPAATAAIARYMVVYMRREGGDPQHSPWLEGRNHIHPAIHRVQDAISADPARDWSLDTIASAGHLSPRHLSRLFKLHTGLALTDYINSIRIALAAQMLRDSRLDMESVAERSGFGSTRHLRRIWGQFHDGPPSAMRRNISA